jgi:hypothetical protein
MAWAVNVCIVSVISLILNVSSRDGDTTLSLFRSLVDVLECYSLASTLSLVKSLGDSSGQCSFTMVNVADGTNVAMRFASLKLLFCHFITSSLISLCGYSFAAPQKRQAFHFIIG